MNTELREKMHGFIDLVISECCYPNYETSMAFEDTNNPERPGEIRARVTLTVTKLSDETNVTINFYGDWFYDIIKKLKEYHIWYDIDDSYRNRCVNSNPNVIVKNFIFYTEPDIEKRAKEAEEKYKDKYINLGWANSDSQYKEICKREEEARRFGWKVKSHTSGHCETTYECEKGNWSYCVDSSD